MLKKDWQLLWLLFFLPRIWTIWGLPHPLCGFRPLPYPGLTWPENFSHVQINAVLRIPVNYFFWQSERKMVVKHQFHSKKTSYQDFKNPKKNSTLPTHTQQPTVEAEATKATQNLRPPSLSVSLSLLWQTFLRTLVRQTCKLWSCFFVHCTVCTILAPVPQTQLAQYRGKKQEAVLARRHNILSKHSLPTTQPQTRDRRALF